MGRDGVIDWSPLRPPRVSWWPTSITVTPLDGNATPIVEKAVTFPLRGRCEGEREGDAPLAPVRCQRHMGHAGDHWAYGRGVWT